MQVIPFKKPCAIALQGTTAVAKTKICNQVYKILWVAKEAELRGANF